MEYLYPLIAYSFSSSFFFRRLDISLGYANLPLLIQFTHKLSHNRGEKN